MPGRRTESKMAKCFSSIRHDLIRLSEPIRESLSRTQYNPPEGTNVSVKSMLESLLPDKNSLSIPEITEEEIQRAIRDFCLCCAALASAEGEKGDIFSWVPREFSLAAKAAVAELSMAFFCNLDGKNLKRIGELGVDFVSVSDERKLVVELMPEVLPLLKGTIKGSSIDPTDDGDEIFAASARTPVAYAIVAAYQFRWFVTQIEYPHLGKLCSLVIPCALTSLDHWSPEVKEVEIWKEIEAYYMNLFKENHFSLPFLDNMDFDRISDVERSLLDKTFSEDEIRSAIMGLKGDKLQGQGMVCFIHLAKNVNAAELGLYEDVILDICCRNIAASDELWHLVVEMSVLLVTCIQRRNPRSSWFERMLNEMLSHLERQPRNRERRTAWLEFIEPVFNGMGLVLLAHFTRIFPLFFQWMHADDDETVILVLQRIHTIIKLTWIRNTPYIERLVNELTITYKEAALKRGREEIRKHVLQILILLQQCKGQQFEAAWDKHRDDPNLNTLALSLSRRDAAMVKNSVFLLPHDEDLLA